MPRIAQKGINMPSSPIRKLSPFADAAKKEGKKVFHLNIGQPDIETPVAMLDALRQVDFKVWAYTPSEGTASYRNKLASYYNKIGYDIGPEHIIVTNGGSEAITIAFLACLDAGDEIIIPEPFYANYNGFACIADVAVKPIPSSIETGFALPSIAAFEKAITAKTKAIAICNPNNPTGYLYSKEEMEALKKLCIEHDLYLFSDEAYREFCYDGRKFISPFHLEGLASHAIVFDTVSKRYSACGARLGCLISKNEEVLQAALKFAQVRLSAPSVAQSAAEAAVDTPQSYFDQVLDEYTQRRDILVEGLNALPGVFCTVPGGAFYVMARLPIDDAERFCKWMLESFSLNNQTVMMAPGTGFYSTKRIGLDEVRLAYVLSQDELKTALACLAEGLRQYPGKTN